MSKRGILFFATKNDLYQKLKSIEKNRSVKYVKCGMYDSKDYIVYSTVDDFHGLGIKTTGDHNDDAFLVLDRSTEIVLREIKQISGETKYSIDQMENPNSIVFWPGGVYGSEYLIHGRIATINDEESKDLYKFFTKNFTVGFIKQREFYVGIEALELAKTVRMITININEPVEYDFKMQ